MRSPAHRRWGALPYGGVVLGMLLDRIMDEEERTVLDGIDRVVTKVKKMAASAVHLKTKGSGGIVHSLKS